MKILFLLYNTRRGYIKKIKRKLKKKKFLSLDDNNNLNAKNITAMLIIDVVMLYYNIITISAKLQKLLFLRVILHR